MSDSTYQGDLFNDFSLKNFASEGEFLIAHFVSSDVN